mgnify:CR=1 FL=1
MAEQREIWVFSEKPALLAELIAGAKTLGGRRVAAWVVGARSSAAQALTQGADRAAWLGDTGGERLVEDYVPTLAQQVQAGAPAVLLIGSTRRGRAVAGRLAARLDNTVLTDVLEFQSEGGDLLIRHMIFGGGAVRVEKALAQPVIATVGSGVFAPLPPAAAAQGEMVEVPFVEPEWRARLIERKPRPPAAVNLAAARKVICAGRGLARQEDLAMINELARALGAEVACTRPLAEGLNWLPRERYIGISGATIKPDLYFGVGVSGQAQHIIGMNRSKVVVALNKDSSAPIFQQADYGVVGDLYAILPALVQAIKARP